jgi:hypothetical protein
MMLSDHVRDHLTPQRRATIYGVGLAAIFFSGILTLIAAVLAGLWLVMQLALLLLTTIVASCNTLAATFASSPDLVKLFILCAAAAIAYKLARTFWRA